MTAPIPMTPNETSDPHLKSWIESANGSSCDFPIQNLPYGVFSSSANSNKRVGVAIGDQILDLDLLEKNGLLKTPKPVFSGPTLNAFMETDPDVWASVRRTISDELRKETSELRVFSNLLTPMADSQLHLPFSIPGYTDFYASREHAMHVGTMFRGAENALMANWLHMPIGYNGRASTVVVSGTPIQRPRGQIKKPERDTPFFGPSQKLDIELEVGAIVGTANDMGTSVSVSQAQEMIFGYVLLNDWSARDIQVWEYQPLGPFLGKAFATTISPWVVSSLALEPFRVEGPAQDPEPLSYLHQSAAHNYDIHLQARLNSDVITETNFKSIYWSSAQQLAHHTSGGCAMRTGDLLGSGTISGSEPGTMGSLLEVTWNGDTPVHLTSGETRTFLEDGDQVVLSGHAQGSGFRIGFGKAIGRIKPAQP